MKLLMGIDNDKNDQRKNVDLSIIFDYITGDMLSNKKLQPILTELLIRRRQI